MKMASLEQIARKIRVGDLVWIPNSITGSRPKIIPSNQNLTDSITFNIIFCDKEMSYMTILENTNPYKASKQKEPIECIVTTKSKKNKRLLNVSPTDESLHYKGGEFFVGGYDFVWKNDTICVRQYHPRTHDEPLTREHLATKYPALKSIDFFIFEDTISYGGEMTFTHNYYSIGGGEITRLADDVPGDKTEEVLARIRDTVITEYHLHDGQLPKKRFPIVLLQNANNSASGRPELIREMGFDAVGLVKKDGYVLHF